MPKYLLEIERTEFSTFTEEIEADDNEHAQQKAIERNLKMPTGEDGGLLEERVSAVIPIDK